MTCNDIRPQLMDYAWQRLPATEAGAVDLHLGGCPECCATLEEERALCRSLASVPVAVPARDMWETIRARSLALSMPASFQPVQTPKAFSARRHVWRPLTLALSAGIAALALMCLPTRQENPVPVAETPVIAQTLEQASSVSRQSDNPMREVSDTTWDTLSDSVKESAS